MQQDHNFTKLIQQWLETPAEERDYTMGALYILKLSGNQILYKNLVAAIDRRHDVIDYQLQKYYNFRVAALTHAEVEEMQAEVDRIVEEHIPLAAETDEQQGHTGQGLCQREQSGTYSDSAECSQGSPHRGKRDDHDALPDDIKACYVENLSLLQRMRELHLKLRTLSLENTTCPDSERYPFLKELIALDKKLHATWEKYDHYVPDNPSTPTAPATKKKTKKYQPSL